MAAVWSAHMCFYQQPAEGNCKMSNFFSFDLASLILKDDVETHRDHKFLLVWTHISIDKLVKSLNFTNSICYLVMQLRTEIF